MKSFLTLLFALIMLPVIIIGGLITIVIIAVIYPVYITYRYIKHGF
jgi:hypothetical protein